MAQKTTAKDQESGRRSERVLLRVPIEVKGKQEDGRGFKERTFTVVINRHGARISLKNTLQPGGQLTITNIQNQIACPFRMVNRQSSSLGDEPEWGVECLEPDVNIWGIFFPTKGGAPAGEEPIDALLECSVCQFRELAQLTQEQYRTLVSKMSISRTCTHCGTERDWTFSFAVSGGDEGAPAAEVEGGAPSEPEERQERRRVKRLTVKVPVLIRLGSGETSLSRTENLSKLGICFISEATLKEGDRFRISVPYTPGSHEIEVPARVIWQRPMEGINKPCFGVEIEQSS
jgi:PilZ domain